MDNDGYRLEKWQTGDRLIAEDREWTLLYIFAEKNGMSENGASGLSCFLSNGSF